MKSLQCLQVQRNLKVKFLDFHPNNFNFSTEKLNEINCKFCPSELFSQTCMTSQSTPVSPFRSIPISNLSLNSSTPKNPSQTSFGNGSTKPDNSVDSTSLCDSASTETSRSRGNDSGRGVSLERVDSAGEGKGASPRQGNEMSARDKRKSLTRQRKETSLDSHQILQEFL